MTVAKKQSNVFDLVQTKENAALNQAVQEGFNNPYNDVDLVKSMHFRLNGSWFKRPIEEFGKIKYQDLNLSQVREEEQDVGYIHNSLIHKFNKKKPHFGLEDPIIINRSDTIQHGHHRSRTMYILGGNNDEIEVPYFKQTSDIYYSNAAGELLGKVKADGASYAKMMSQILPNPPMKNKEYTMSDIAVQAKAAYAADSTLLGLNPSGDPWSKSLLSKWMKDAHPNQFTDSSTQGKILKKLQTQNSSIVIGSPTFADYTNMYVSQGMPNGVIKKTRKNGETKLSRKSFMENYYPGNKHRIAAEKSDRGKDFERDMCWPLLENFDLEKGSQNVNGMYEIELLAHISSPQTNQAALDMQRAQFKLRIERANEVFNRHGRRVKFTKVTWMPQLVGVETPGNAVTEIL